MDDKQLFHWFKASHIFLCRLLSLYVGFFVGFLKNNCNVVEKNHFITKFNDNVNFKYGITYTSTRFHRGQGR